MMKTTGILIIVVSAAYFGFINYSKLKKRPEDIEMFIRMISEYRTRLGFEQSTFEEVVNDFVFAKNKEYIENARVLSHDNGYITAFIDGNSYFGSLSLVKSDVEQIRYFFENSGKNSLEYENSLCEKTINSLKICKEDAAAKFKKNGTLAIKVALIIAIWIIIILV